MEILQQLVNGLTIGSIYALVAIGFSVVYGVLGLVNFGHGSVLMAGTFMAYWLSGLGVPIWVACIAGIALGAALNGLVEIVSVRPVLHANLLIPMMTTFGMALIIRNLAELKFGSSTLPFPTFAGAGFVEVAGVGFARSSVVTLGVAIAALVLFALFLRYTRVGFEIRAVAQDRTAARLMGMRVTRTISLVYVIGGALGVVGGVLFSNALGIVFLGMSFPLLIKGFAAAVIGGIGNLQGAMIGGVLLGVLESVIGSNAGPYRDSIAFVLLIAFLLVRPTGLLGARIQERV